VCTARSKPPSVALTLSLASWFATTVPLRTRVLPAPWFGAPPMALMVAADEKLLMDLSLLVTEDDTPWWWW